MTSLISPQNKLYQYQTTKKIKQNSHTTVNSCEINEPIAWPIYQNKNMDLSLTFLEHILSNNKLPINAISQQSFLKTQHNFFFCNQCFCHAMTLAYQLYSMTVGFYLFICFTCFKFIKCKDMYGCKHDLYVYWIGIILWAWKNMGKPFPTKISSGHVITLII